MTGGVCIFTTYFFGGLEYYTIGQRTILWIKKLFSVFALILLIIT